MQFVGSIDPISKLIYANSFRQRLARELNPGAQPSKLLRMKNILTTAQASDYLSVSPARVRKFIRDRRLPAEKHGRDYFIDSVNLKAFAKHGRKSIGRPQRENRTDAMAGAMVAESKPVYNAKQQQGTRIGNGEIYTGDALEILPRLEKDIARVVLADPPYYQVLTSEAWDNRWRSTDDYLQWTVKWVRECKRVLRHDGLLYIFGQLGKREHVWLHTCSLLAKEMQFHDMIIWDRAVGYNERHDSFTPQYEMILVLRKSADAAPYFDKDAVRVPYQEEKIQMYLRDKRYKNKQTREAHLRKGKYATNILRVPSLKGSSKEKRGHPSQKPIALINHLIRASSREGELVIDPFLGSGTTAEAAEINHRRWLGIEEHEAYVEMAKRRIESHAAQKILNFA